MSLDDLSTEQQVGLVGAAAVVIGAFLPWLEVTALGSTVVETGMDRGGWFTSILAVLAIVALAKSDWSKELQGMVVAVGGVLSVYAGLYVIDPFVYGYTGPEEQRELAESAVTVAPGLYVTFLGGLVLIFVGALALNTPTADAPTVGPEAAERADVEE